MSGRHGRGGGPRKTNRRERVVDARPPLSNETDEGEEQVHVAARVAADCVATVAAAVAQVGARQVWKNLDRLWCGVRLFVFKNLEATAAAASLPCKGLRMDTSARRKSAHAGVESSWGWLEQRKHRTIIEHMYNERVRVSRRMSASLVRKCIAPCRQHDQDIPATALSLLSSSLAKCISRAQMHGRWIESLKLCG